MTGINACRRRLKTPWQSVVRTISGSCRPTDRLRCQKRMEQLLRPAAELEEMDSLVAGFLIKCCYSCFFSLRFSFLPYKLVWCKLPRKSGTLPRKNVVSSNLTTANRTLLALWFFFVIIQKGTWKMWISICRKWIKEPSIYSKTLSIITSLTAPRNRVTFSSRSITGPCWSTQDAHSLGFSCLFPRWLTGNLNPFLEC